MLYNLNIMFIEKQKYLGEKIRQSRAIAHLSQIKLSKIIGIGKNSMIDTEKGKREPSLTELKKIAEATNQPLKFFLEEEKPEIKPSDEYLDISGIDDDGIEVLKQMVDCLRDKSQKNELEKTIT